MLRLATPKLSSAKDGSWPIALFERRRQFQGSGNDLGRPEAEMAATAETQIRLQEFSFYDD
jgi:hypothetical protein